jgi:hypothetical protein
VQLDCRRDMTTPPVTNDRLVLRVAPVAGTPAAMPDLDAGLEAVGRSLRGARSRTGMSEPQVVAVLAAQGVAITVARLRSWERTGVIRVDAAAHLADAYGTTIDALAGRRAYRSQPRGDPAGPR